jgi:CRISPR-associated protein Cmr5
MSLQRTQEQARAAAAWANIKGCLAQVIEVVRKDVDDLQRRRENNPNDSEVQGRYRSCTARLAQLQSEKGGRDWKKSFSSHVKKFPMLVLANGLGTALAFLKAKGGNDPRIEEEILYQYISQWVTAQIWGGSGDANLLTRLVTSASDIDYRRATKEALAFIVWLKRFAEAEFEAKPEFPLEPQEASAAVEE